MKKIILLIAFAFTIVTGVSGQNFQWAKSQPNCMDGPVIAAGNTILATAGKFYNTITLGSQTFNSPDSMDTYLAVHDLSGNILWAKHIINHSYNRNQVSIDQNQNIFVSGTFRDSLYIGSLLIKGTTPNSQGIFLVKFNSAGNLLWSRSSTISASLQPSETSLDTDGNGNAFLAGIYKGNLTFGSTNLLTTTTPLAYLTKYDTNGNLQWAVNSGMLFGPTIQEQAKVKTTTNGDAYLAYLNNSSIAPEVGLKVIKFSPAGTQLWNTMAAISTLPNSWLFGVEFDLATDHTGNAYITGTNRQGITFINLSSNFITLPNNTTKSLFLAKINQTGKWVWARSLAGGNYAATSPSIYLNPNNELAVAGSFTGTANFISSIPLTSNPQNLSNTFVVSLDTAGAALWTNQVTGSNPNWNSDITADANGDYYLGGNFTSGTINFNSISLSTTSFNERYLAKISSNLNQVNGIVFIDQNANGVQDPSELPFQDLLLQATPSGNFGISAATGNYRLYFPPGNYSISMANPPRHYIANPSSHPVSFSGSSQVQNGKDFPLQPLPNRPDVQIIVTNITEARAGGKLKYQLTYRNVGTTTLSDSISLNYTSANLTFASATVIPVVQQAGLLKWTYQNLQPNERREIIITLDVAINAVMNTKLQAVAGIKPFIGDLFIKDNRDTLNHLVVASFDPNDKQVDKPFLSPTAGAAGEYLDYTIRFQNTGTDTAFTVIITDIISSKLNLENFEMLSASHPYTMSLTRNQTLEWRFNNILLPDSNRNEPASHGFVRFRIKSKPGLVIGDSIANQAAIYFDYNAPVITNYAVTKVANPMAVQKPKAALQEFKLYPNPAKNYVMVAAELKKATAITVRLVNVLGQVISEVNFQANNQLHYQLPLQNLPKGVYMVQLESEAGRQTQRLVVQ